MLPPLSYSRTCLWTTISPKFIFYLFVRPGYRRRPTSRQSRQICAEGTIKFLIKGISYTLGKCLATIAMHRYLTRLSRGFVDGAGRIRFLTVVGLDVSESLHLLPFHSLSSRRKGSDLAIMFPFIPTALLALTSIASAALVPSADVQQRSFEYVIKPKVFIISLFRPEAEIWHGIPEFDILAMNITVPGFSPLVSNLLPLRRSSTSPNGAILETNITRSRVH